jgi:hypothetical protein
MNSPYDVVLGYGKFGVPNKAVSQSSMGELYDFGREVLIPNTRNSKELGLEGTGKGSSALGAYQIVGDTMQSVGKQLYGDRWRDVQFTPEVQESIAKKLYEDSDKKNLHNIWTSLPQKDYSGSTWEDIRDTIMKGESGGVVPTRQAAENEDYNRLKAIQQAKLDKSNEILGLAQKEYENSLANSRLQREYLGSRPEGGYLDRLGAQLLNNAVSRFVM